MFERNTAWLQSLSGLDGSSKRELRPGVSSPLFASDGVFGRYREIHSNFGFADNPSGTASLTSHMSFLNTKATCAVVI